MRTYKSKIEKAREHRHLGPEQIAAAKNQRCKARNTSRREEKQKEAARICNAWRDKSPKEKLEILERRPGQSLKQTAKIINMITAET